MPEVEGVVEQEVQAAPDEGVTATESATEEQQEPQDDKPKPKGGFEKRIDRLTKHNSQLEQEKEYWRQEALRTKSPATETKTAPTAEGKPSENDFSTHAEFLEALTDWKVDQRFKTTEASKVAEQVQTQAQKAQQDFKGRQEAFRAATPDFDEVLADADIQVSNSVISEIVESESGPQLQYYLAKNPDEAARLSKLAPLALAREVGKIESRFTTSQQKTAVKTSSAPPPPTPTGKSSATSTKDPGEMTPAEYRKWREKQ